MRYALLIAFSIFALANAAHAATISLSLTNYSGDSLDGLTASSKSEVESSTQNVLAEGIPQGQTGDAVIETSDGECIFDLVFTFASGRRVERPDTDICQTDGIIVE